MTLKEMFKKVEAYNEIADMMKTDKAQIYFHDCSGCCSFGEHFTSFKELRKYIKNEYMPEIAEKLLEADNWELDGEVEIEWRGGIDRFGAELTAC